MFLSSTDELLYVGKAKDLRRRLAQHERSGFLAQAAHVRWLVCAHEADALLLEADIIVALQPPLNAAMSREELMFVALRDDRFILTSDAAADGRVFGAFPHLGKGKATSKLVRSNAGFAAFLRLLWSSGTDRPPPARLRGESPPSDHRSPIVDRRGVCAFLSGASDRLLSRLHPMSDDPLTRRGFGTDLDEARAFFAAGPKRMRMMVRRHGRHGPVDRTAFAEMVASDLRRVVGDVVLPAVTDIDHVQRRMARAHLQS